MFDVTSLTVSLGVLSMRDSLMVFIQLLLVHINCEKHQEIAYIFNIIVILQQITRKKLESVLFTQVTDK